jgi:hypothetical protein
MYHWIQVTEMEAPELEDKKLIPRNSGYKYNHPESRERMLEYHFDTCNLFQERMNDKTQLGGRRSVRYPDGKMLVVWGYDVCIVKQYTLSKKLWIGTNGKTAIVAKDEGCGIMISAFQCREFGFGLELTAEELEHVHSYRKDKLYKDEMAAKAKRGCPKKRPLTKSLFIHFFEYGSNGEGYWVYEHMVLLHVHGGPLMQS